MPIRFYAGDPDQTVTEIHDDNNKGWAVLRMASATSVDDDYYDHPAVPAVFSLDQNYPNPFNPSTTIRLSIPERVNVTLIVHDILGRRVATLVDDRLPAGTYTQVFDASRLASGMYVYQLRAGTHVETKRFILLK